MFVVTNTKEPKMCLLRLKTTFFHKTLNLFKVLNIEISSRTRIKSQNIFNVNKARNMVTIWIFCVYYVPNKKTNKQTKTKQKQKKWSESSILSYNLIISKRGTL